MMAEMLKAYRLQVYSNDRWMDSKSSHNENEITQIFNACVKHYGGMKFRVLRSCGSTMLAN
jgi:hypothetical protein